MKEEGRKEGITGKQENRKTGRKDIKNGTKEGRCRKAARN